MCLAPRHHWVTDRAARSEEREEAKKTKSPDMKHKHRQMKLAPRFVPAGIWSSTTWCWTPRATSKSPTLACVRRTCTKACPRAPSAGPRTTSLQRWRWERGAVLFVYLTPVGDVCQMIINCTVADITFSIIVHSQLKTTTMNNYCYAFPREPRNKPRRLQTHGSVL